MDLQGFGNGQDGSATLSGTDAPIDSSCSGTGGTKSLSATNASFADDRIILIHQSRGTGAGNWELNVIDSYSAGTITTLFDLVNTYTDSGASQAQVLQLKEYTDVTISGTFTGKAWDGNVGGIVAFLVTGNVDITGTLTVSGKGFRGGTGVAGTTGNQGEGTGGAGSGSTAANGNGGGGGQGVGTGAESSGGGGGGNGAAGEAGINNHTTAGSSGAASGSADLSTMTFGGGGGGSARGGTTTGTGGSGGVGGGIVAIWCGGTLTVTGSINLNGTAGTNGIPDEGGGGGGGAGGSGYFVCGIMICGTNLITAAGGAYGNPANGNSYRGGTGAVGRIAIEACDITGSTSPTANEDEGGHTWCMVPGSIY